jgi:hypothetical protein
MDAKIAGRIFQPPLKKLKIIKMADIRVNTFQ